MAIDFFEKEVAKVQSRFNQTFGQAIVIKLERRYEAILTITHLGRLANKIRKGKPMNSKMKVKEFMRCKAALYSMFNKLEKELNQGKEMSHERDHYGTSHGSRRYGNV